MNITYNGNPPTRQHPEDAGADLTADHDAVIPARHSVIIDTGTAVQLHPGTVGIVASRSGHGFRHDITLANSIGVIDSNYRGNIRCKLINHSDHDYTVHAGERIAQLLILPVIAATFTPGTLNGSDRGTNGIGSTGQ